MDRIDLDKMEIKIRTACPEDAGQIRDIYAHYVLHTAITYEYEVPSLACLPVCPAGRADRRFGYGRRKRSDIIH